MSYDLPLMVYVIGPTNAGKSTMLDLCALHPDIVTVEVGKMMRAKYPPEHFQGQCNPKHTAVEAWQMYLDGVQRGIDNPECKLIICDGQPRDIQQTEDVIANKTFFKVFVHLWAPDEARAKRARDRDYHSPEALALSQARMISDIPANYGVLVRLINAKESVWSYDTSATTYSARLLLDTLLAHAYYHRRAHNGTP